MGKEKTASVATATELQNSENVECNTDNKENSIKTQLNFKDFEETSIELKINKAKPVTKDSEVLEDDSCNNSNSTKYSDDTLHSATKSSTSLSLSSSTSNLTPSNNNKKIRKRHQKIEEGGEKDDIHQEGEEDTGPATETEQPKFCVASNNTTNFKLRIVPLEKLLEKPLPQHQPEEEEAPLLHSSENKESKSEETKSKRLPRRSTRKPVVFDSSETEGYVEVISSSESEKEKHRRKINLKDKRHIKKPLGPPSPSTVRRCLVKLKRFTLPLNLKQNITNKSKGRKGGNSPTMYGSKEIMFEKPSTSSGKRKQNTSDDEDSDFAFDLKISESNHSEDDNEDSDGVPKSSSDSEIMPTRKRRVFRKDSNASDSDFEPEPKEKKKRRRVKQDSSDDSDEDEKKGGNKRKHIRKIIRTEDLDVSTKTATKEEEERRRRIEERQKLYNKIYEKQDSVEVTELVLDFDPETKETLLEVDRGLLKKLKPHQVTGVKFMWDACFETIKDAQEKQGSGCILAHCMGLGKTVQIVTLTHTLLTNSRKSNVERVLVITPLSTLNNWAREFKHWMSFARKRNIEIYDMSKYKDKQTRIFKLNEWFEEGGVCILGYDMYRILANEKAKGLRKKQREQLQNSLVNPGADLVICDEGHLLKNEKTSISKAVTRMRTKRRIVLTGTPLQNNLKEYYCMIQFIKPNLLGTYKEYLNRFVNPISNGQYTDSTERDIRLMKHRSHILHKLLEGCIQRRDYSVLAPYLPPKHEYVVYTTLSELQQQLYEHYMVHQRDITSSDLSGKGARLFQDFQELRRIWTHPMNMRINSDSVIRKKVLNNENDSMDDFICDNDDEEEDIGSTSESSVCSSKSFGSAGGGGDTKRKVVKTRNYRKNARELGEVVDGSDSEEVQPAPNDDPSEWWKRFVAEKELNNINHSPKLVILMRLLQECEAIGDKVLVFSQSLQSLDTIEHFLALIDSKTRGHEYEGDVGDFKGFWRVGTDYFRLDGSCSVEQRETMCRKFNDSSNLRARLFLISTRAGGLGINLVSANRVVIFDVSWNPSHDTQSIFRVYRFGQDKPCYIYRLIAMGTMEQKLYERQVAKQATAKRVIDEQQISRHYNQSDLLELYTYELKPSMPREIPILPKDRLFAELLSEHEHLLFKYHEHDSLLENEESENLSEAERKAAWSEYEAEKTRTVQTAQYMAYDRNAYGGQYGNASGSVTSNKIFGFRTDILLQLLNMKVAKDHPELAQTGILQLVPTYLQQLYTEMNSGDPSMYKELLNLHGTLAHPSGMYMNPLLYVNQNPAAAGYFQAAQQPGNGLVNPMQAPIANIPPHSAPGFDPNQVYEID